jgi:LysM repeat protein
VTRIARLILIAVLSSLAVLAGPAEASGAAPVYVVKNGDSLIGIAGRLGVKLSALMSANDLSLTSVIYPGQRLAVPGAAAPAATGGGTYTVRSGDALSLIAARHDVPLSALLAANNLTVDSVIHPGQRLTLPAGATGGTPAPAIGGGGTYTVRPGDYLGLIAARHDVSLAAVLAANNLTVNSVIHPGQRLSLPAGATGVAPQPASGGGGGGGGSYTVRPGDALGLIAARHDVSLSALLAANNLTVNSVIHPGQRLTLPAGAVISDAQRVVNFALAQVGKPYKFFSAGPASFDCSGLTKAAYEQVGVDLVHHSATQARQGRPVDFTREAIRPGDLVFLSTRGAKVINHVGIAVNANSWVQARSPALGVRITAMPPDSSIIAVRRFL